MYSFHAPLIAILLLVLVSFLTVFCLRCRYKFQLRRRRRRGEPVNREHAKECKHLIEVDSDSLSSQEESEDESIRSNEAVFISFDQDNADTVNPLIKPGKPRAMMSSVSFNSIELEWTKPEQGAHNNIITSYIVHGSTSNSPYQWIEQNTITVMTDDKSCEKVLVTNLLEKTTYYFKIRPECAAENVLDSEISEPIKTKGIIPSQPGKPMGSSLSYDSIHLEWTKPEQGAHNVIAYHVFCHSDKDSLDEWIKVKTEGIQEKMTVSQLLERTLYSFKIQAESADGLGPESEVSEQIPTKIMVPGKPGKPKASKITHDSINLEWTKPEQGDHNITIYTILYSSTNDPPDKWREQKTKAAKERATVTGLSEKTTYLFKVRPESENGESGLESDESEHIQTAMIIPSKPGKPKAVNVTHDSIELEWTKPEQGAHNVMSYSIYGSTSNSPDHWTKQNNITVTTDDKLCDKVLITNLLEKTTYYFKIRPECAAENVLDSEISEPIKTKGIIPSQPGKPVGSSLSYDSIHLEWTKPEQGAHNVIAYHIFCHSDKDSPDKWIKVKTEGIQEKMTVSQLLERTLYSFKIQAESADGLGPESEVSEQIPTKIMVPGKPGKPKASKITDKSINLEWTKPEQGDHNITIYTILYSSTNDPPDTWREQKTKEAKEGATVTGLSEKTTYLFKVRPESENGQSGLESDESEPVQTAMIIPSEPGKPKAVNVTHDSIELEWTKPEQGAHNVPSYIVHGSTRNTPYQWIEQGVTTDDRLCERMHIENLREKTNYYFKIRPERIPGIRAVPDSKISEPIKTKGIIPSQPGKPVGSSLSHDSIQLEWTKPEQGAHNVIAYHVFCHSDKDSPDEWIKVKTEGIQETMTVSQLLERTLYSFKIQAESADGLGPESEVSEQTPTKIMVPGKPGKPKASKITHDNIDLEWTKPEQGAHNITIYTILYSSTNDPPDKWKEQKTKAAEERATVTGLSEKTTYLFKVRPESENGESSLESDESKPIQTAMIIPSKPGKPKAVSFSQEHMDLEWTKPKEGGHNIASYTVFYCHTADGSDQWTKIETKKNSVTVPKISKKHTYYFKICLECKDGSVVEGDISGPIKFLTFTDILGKLQGIGKKWYPLGAALGVEIYFLDEIENDNKNDKNRWESCLIDMINRWLRHLGGSWEKLISALKDKSVGLNHLADSITKSLSDEADSEEDEGGEGFECPYCGECSIEQYSKRGCLKFTASSDEPFPYLDTRKLTKKERQTLHLQLLEETEEINKAFAKFIKQVRDSFKQRIDSKELVASVIDIAPQEPVENANSVIVVISDLQRRNRISFYNYHEILEHLINVYGTEDDKVRLKAYEAKFKEYCKRSIYKVPKGVFAPPPDDDQVLGFKVAAHKSTKNLPDFNLDDAKTVQRKIARILGIEKYVGSLIFLGARKGCIELKFSAPRALLDRIQQQHNVKTLTEVPGFAALEKEGISILCGPPGKPYEDAVTSNNINVLLKWSKPEYQGSQSIQYYLVHYKSLNDPSAKWRVVQSDTCSETFEMRRLFQNNMSFIFKVQAVNAIGAGLPSENSDPINLVKQSLMIPKDFHGKPGKPGKPKALTIAHNSIQLEWTKPEGVESIISYTILYHAQFNDPPNQWTEIRTASSKEKVIISHLFENTTYYFQVQPEYENGIGLESYVRSPSQPK